MFHRSTAKPDNNTSGNAQKEMQRQEQPKQYRSRVESSAVERYAKNYNEPQNEVVAPKNQANQNSEAMYAVENQQTNLKPIENEKEVSSMNNPEPQAKNNTQDADKPAAPQNRDVNIPGNNFQRPGAPAVAGRPAYPGSYAAGTPANSPYGSTNNDSGRKLVIGEGITMSGEIESCEHLIVQGTIEATLKGASLLDVSESGAFLGTVEIEEANIAGRFEGDITVKGRLTIESTGQVVGSISYKELSMEAGAVIDGAVSPIGSANAMNNKKSAPTKSKKASTNNGAELPFSDNKAEAAE